MSRLTLCLALALLSAIPAGGAHAQRPSPARQRSSATDARQFIQEAERRLEELGIKLNRAAWVGSNFITEDTEALSADAEEEYNVAVQQLATAARRFDGVQLPADQRRILTRLRLLLAAPPPAIAAEATELTKLTTSMQADYGKGTYCRKKDECLQINDLNRILAESRDPAELLDAWQGWHQVGAPLRKPYTRFVELSNKGARGLGASDLGALWRSGYDMPPEAFAEEVERLWSQVRPLYLSLHGYVRSHLTEKYGPELVPPGGMIPAHLLGNMWAQEWGNIYDVVAPRGVAAQGYDLTKLLQARKVDQLRMVRYGERFFTSLGLPQLPATFWERSLIVKPLDREVVCHASAWNIDDEEDVRIKMCTEVNGEDFITVHHELGHNYYSLAYKDQPYLFKSGAHDGFHEAVGDAIALAITPEYLRTVRLLDRVPTEASDTALLLRQAMDKVAFLPFGLLIDQWRWKVFSGEIKPAEYNASWWTLRNSYQGVSAPLPRTEADFDPGAKLHVPGNTPYTRYFLARILQFQFYRALCREAGYQGPLHRCSFFGSKEAGRKLQAMLALGASRPWPEVLHAMTGEREMDAGAMVEYFAPLAAWLDRQNRGRQLGWAEAAPAGGR
ncbi:MAG: M2 family metallopeptidase [Gemmatimonadales bacterium]|nr:M2 family metallopeptidase [Gemmatimonadales bacterium]